MQTLINSYCNAEELHVNEYGEAFFNEMVGLIKDRKISEADAVAVIECLVDIDEIRILLAGELRECIVSFAEEGNFSRRLLDLLRKMSLARFDVPDYSFVPRMQSLLYDLINEDLNLEQAINSL